MFRVGRVSDKSAAKKPIHLHPTHPFHNLLVSYHPSLPLSREVFPRFKSP